MPTKSYIYCMRANMVAMIQKFGMHWAIYSIDRQRLSANKLHLCKFEYKVKTMSIWWICIVSRPQTTLISQWGRHIFIPLQWRHNQHNGASNHKNNDKQLHQCKWDSCWLIKHILLKCLLFITGGIILIGCINNWFNFDWNLNFKKACACESTMWWYNLAIEVPK